MSAQDRWIFTKEQLRRVPSITESNMTEKEELWHRQQAARLTQEIGQRLKVHSFAKYPFQTLAPVSLFLAAKVEEQPRKLEHIIKVSQICIYRENVDPKSERYQSLAAQLVYSENLMLRTLGFDLNIQHAHTSIVNCCQLVRATKNIAETSYYLATNSLHLSTLCLQYKPTVVACICIYFVCKWSNFLIPKSHEGKEWWTYIDDTVNKEMLEGLMNKSISKLENNVFSSLFSINENSQNSLNHSMNNMNSSTSMTLNFDLNSLNHTMDSSSLLNHDSDSLNHTFDASSLNADMDSNHTMDASYANDSISFNHNSGDASSNIDAVSQQEHTPVEAPASTLTTETADDSSDHSKKHKKKHKHKEKHKHKDKHKHKHKDKEKEKEKHREKYNVEPSFQIQQQPETGSKVAPLKLKILTTKRSRDELGDSSPVEDEGKIQPIKIKFSALSNHQRSSPESPDNIDLPVSRKRKRSDKKDIKKALKQVFSDLEANIDN
ncbi:Cyclin-T2 [Tyrophagus putrescentiae]|nr:Cyclin-T2 [Tyrophagus putrescentiae]